MHDPRERFASATVGRGIIRTLNIDAVATALAEALEGKIRLSVCNGDSRGRFRISNLESRKAGLRTSKREAGREMRAEFLNRFFWGMQEVDVLCGSAASAATWSRVADRVTIEMHRRSASDDVPTWVQQNFEKSPDDDYVIRAEALDKIIEAIGGTRVGRARELATALVTMGFSDVRQDPRRRINGITTSIIPGVRWKTQLTLPLSPLRDDNPFLT